MSWQNSITKIKVDLPPQEWLERWQWGLRWWDEEWWSKFGSSSTSIASASKRRSRSPRPTTRRGWRRRRRKEGFGRCNWRGGEGRASRSRWRNSTRCQTINCRNTHFPAYWCSLHSFFVSILALILSYVLGCFFLKQWWIIFQIRLFSDNISLQLNFIWKTNHCVSLTFCRIHFDQLFLG